jgi:hypothetical protein
MWVLVPDLLAAVFMLLPILTDIGRIRVVLAFRIIIGRDFLRPVHALWYSHDILAIIGIQFLADYRVIQHKSA